MYPCLEAQIVDLADEIAYLAHDVDDGLKAQMLTEADSLTSLLYSARIGGGGAAPPDPAGRDARDALSDGHQDDRRDGHRFDDEPRRRAASATRYAASRTLRRRAGRWRLSGPRWARRSAEIKQIMRDRLYRHYRVSRMTEKAGGCWRSFSRPT